ncbi:22889_t:CDS:2, partial [Racocetra persica]
TVLLLKEKASPEPIKLNQSTTYDINDGTQQVSDEYEIKLATLSYTKELSKILENGPEKKYWGIIATSQKAVKGLKLAWNNSFNDVTEATAKAADDLNFNTLGLKSGNSESLAEYIIQFHSENNPTALSLLFLTGDKRLDKLPTRLSEVGIKLEELLVYETRPDENFSTEMVNIVKNNRQMDWIVFFSPSGVDVALESLMKLDLWKTVKIACIGKTTGDYLEKNGIKVHVISPKPEPESLACSINKYPSSEIINC